MPLSILSGKDAFQHEFGRPAEFDTDVGEAENAIVDAAAGITPEMAQRLLDAGDAEGAATLNRLLNLTEAREHALTLPC